MCRSEVALDREAQPDGQYKLQLLGEYRVFANSGGTLTNLRSNGNLALALLLTLAAIAPLFARDGSQAVPPLYGPAGVSPAAVRQGTLGSCYFHSTIAAIANQKPDALRGAIEDIGGGSYRVRFLDAQAETVELGDVMYARQNNFDNSDGLWVVVLLRGMAQRTMREMLVASIDATPLPKSARETATTIVKSSDQILLAYDRAIRSATSQDGTLNREILRNKLNQSVDALKIPFFISKPVIDFLDEQGFFEVLSNKVHQNGELFGAYRSVGQGGLPTRVMEAFYSPAHSVNLQTSEQARADLKVMQQQGLPMVAISADRLDGTIQLRVHSHGESQDWFVGNHAYTVLAYNMQTDMVTVRNPWADHPEPDGVFTISTSDFVSAYPILALANR